MHICYPSVSNSELHLIPLMSKLTNDQLDKIKSNAKIIHLGSGEHLFEQGDVADRFYLVRSGQIKLYRLSFEGNERVINIIHPGQVFADSIQFQETKKYPYSADAVYNAELLSFDFNTFRNVLNDSKETCFRIMSDMSHSLQMYLDQVDYLTLQNASFRLVSFLLQQIPEDHQPEHPYIIKLTTPKGIIASWLSIKPETFSRILRSLKAQNVIAVDGKTITIQNVGQLREIAI